MADLAPDNFESALGSSMPEPGATSPAPKVQERSYSPEEQESVGQAFSSLQTVLKQSSTGRPPVPSTVTAPALPDGIPEPPDPVPGAYSPEREQAALRAADTIVDPGQRLRVQQYLKQKYANDRLMDGITAQARDQTKNKSIAKWSNIVEQIISGEGDWKTKQTIVSKILPVMRVDPTLDIGETKNLLEEHLLNQAGMPNVRELGSGYIRAQDAVVNGQITSNDQILRMEVDGQLTHKGAQWTMESLKNMNSPKGLLDVERTRFFKLYERTIDPSISQTVIGEHTALGDQHLYLMERAARAREEEIAKAKGNPADIYNPNSKEFFGTSENLAKYVVTQAEAAKYEADIAKGKMGTASSADAPSSNPVDVPQGMSPADVIQKFAPGTVIRLPNGQMWQVPKRQ